MLFNVSCFDLHGAWNGTDKNIDRRTSVDHIYDDITGHDLAVSSYYLNTSDAFHIELLPEYL
jgi:hypothetical protein